MDITSCPIVAGTPKVIRAAFTKEIDFFAQRNIEYIDHAVSMVEPFLLKRQMFEAWGGRLEITEDENDFAVNEGFKALQTFERDLQQRGKAILEQVEKENRIAILMIGRPYHSDPGINHGIPEEFQALGYPIVSVRSIPQDKQWLERFFHEDLISGRINTPLEINDVWPENFSTHSAQKVWATKFAARHPNIAVLDLSNFKCGHDAPTYGLIDCVMAAASTPHLKIHDIDANKSTESINIRIKTYAHTLKRREEQLIYPADQEQTFKSRLIKKRHGILANDKVCNQQQIIPFKSLKQGSGITSEITLNRKKQRIALFKQATLENNICQICHNTDCSHCQSLTIPGASRAV